MSVKTISYCEVIYLKEDAVLRLGSSYSMEIFYQYKNQVREFEASLVRQNSKLSCLFRDEKGEPGEKRILNYGEDVWIEGLCLFFLGKYLVLYSMYGNLRVNCRNRRILS